MRSVDFEVRGTWDGAALASGEEARVRASIDRARGVLDVVVSARFYADPQPDAPSGSRPGLWDFEVVELFLVGEAEEYLEVELGPHGHFLVLRLSGRRNVVESEIPIAYRARLDGDRWTGRAAVPLDRVPEPVRFANAYAIHGTGASRRHLAAHPVPGDRPDFHRLECFPPCALA